MIELSVASILSTAPAISALVGSRVYPVTLPTDPTLPALDYKFVGGSSTATQDTYGTQRYRLEVNCWGNTYSDAVTLRAAVVATLSQYSADGVFIAYLMPQDFFEDEILQYRAMAEFYVFANFNT